ncbi:Ribonuclease H2 subunit B [Eumeta japonica]|uniref:Ribonuclease H2 subunit B n=1 Tax=Eumeta variegata TaxID=151549 RepID=A0A4C1VSU4_EUMVA|nr:Ribonuclease H2 subunit B [Eumeta japonica]
MFKPHKKSVASPENNRIVKKTENSWILLAKETLFENKSFVIISLPHPATENLVNYCLDEKLKKMYEIVTYDEPYRSWFIGETVKSDGSIQILTPINPLFVILPLLRKECISRAVPLDDLLSEKNFDKIIDYISDIDKIADLKASADVKAYKYNEEKTLNWLESRVRKLAKVLRHKNIHVTTGSMSSTFVSSNINNDDIDEEFYIKYGYELISEYIQDDLMEVLKKRFNFQPTTTETLNKKRKLENTQDTNNSIKKIKPTNNIEEIENVVCTPIVEMIEPKKTTVRAKEKARQKAATGTKNVRHLFATDNKSILFLKDKYSKTHETLQL